MNEKILSYEEITENYVIYYYANNGVSLTSKLNKRCFRSEDELKEFIEVGSYTSIDAIYIDGKRVHHKVETKIEFYK